MGKGHCLLEVEIFDWESLRFETRISPGVDMDVHPMFIKAH